MEDSKQKAKDQILYLLKMKGAQTATALAKQLQISPMAVRQHLQVLKAEQWIAYREERRPLGRPVKLWQLTERARDRFPDSHADLMLDLLQSIETLFGEEGLEQLLAERRCRQVQIYQEQLAALDDAKTWQKQVEAIAHIRSQEGYMAETIEQAEDGALLLVENHCPICTAAQACPGLCRTELEVFQALLGPEIAIERVEHILKGDRRCAYRIQPVA